MDDNAIIATCLRGRGEEFRDIVDRHQGPALAMALNILRNRQDAEDICQEAFVQAYRNLAQFDPQKSFRPWLLRRAEFLREPGVYRFHDLEGRPASPDVPAGSLAFTYCQVPVLYELSPADAWIRVTRRDGAVSTRAGCALDAAESRSLLMRDGGVCLVHIGVPEGSLCGL